MCCSWVISAVARRYRTSDASREGCPLPSSKVRAFSSFFYKWHKTEDTIVVSAQNIYNNNIHHNIINTNYVLFESESDRQIMEISIPDRARVYVFDPMMV